MMLVVGISATATSWKQWPIMAVMIGVILMIPLQNQVQLIQEYFYQSQNFDEIQSHHHFQFPQGLGKNGLAISPINILLPSPVSVLNTTSCCCLPPKEQGKNYTSLYVAKHFPKRYYRPGKILVEEEQEEEQERSSSKSFFETPLVV
jgi:hypothetical protein